MILPTAQLASTFPPSALAPLTPLDLDAVDAGQVGRADALSLPPLLVDCGQLQLQLLRTRGVSHVVSLLLELRGRGATICLCKMPPALARCLQLLRVDQLFPVVD